MAASDNEYPYTTQSVTGETPVTRWFGVQPSGCTDWGRL